MVFFLNCCLHYIVFQPLWVICHAWFNSYNIVKRFGFFSKEQSDAVLIKFQTFDVAIVWKRCFIMHLFGKSPIYASTVLESSCCKIHRYIAAPLYHQNSTVCRSKIATLLNNIGNPFRICARILQVLPSPEPYHVPSIQLGVKSGIRIPKPLVR